MGSQMRMGIVIVCVSVCVSCIILAAPWRACRAEMKPDTLIQTSQRSDGRTHTQAWRNRTPIDSDLQRSSAIYGDLQHSDEALCNDLAINEACIYTHKYYIY